MSMGSHTSGPVHLFARFRSGTTGLGPYYLGTCVASPEPEHTKSRIPIFNDIAGRNEPFQIVKDGENATVMATMNRFDYSLLQSIRALDSSNTPNPNPPGGNLNAGAEDTFTRGTFVIGVTDFQLLLWAQYAGTVSAGTALDESPIRQYNSVEQIVMKETRAGTRVLEVACAFKCTSVYNYTALNFAGGTGNTAGGLYTEAPSRLGGVTPAILLAIVAATAA